MHCIRAVQGGYDHYLHVGDGVLSGRGGARGASSWTSTGRGLRPFQYSSSQNPTPHSSGRGRGREVQSPYPSGALPPLLTTNELFVVTGNDTRKVNSQYRGQVNC